MIHRYDGGILRAPTYTVIFFDADWCEIPELTRRYLKPGEVVRLSEWFVDLWVALAKGHPRELLSKSLPVGFTTEVTHG